jgi:hypothetical protein
MSLSFVVVCEARNDFLTASELADRVLCESVEWIEPEMLNALREYAGLPGHERFLTWKRVKALAKESLLLPRGLIDGRPGELDAQQARRALYYIESSWPGVDAILLIRDDDRLVDRRRGLEQARAASPLRDRIVIGLAHTKRECWVLAGFEPCNDQERSLLAAIRQDLGFDPREQAEQLTAIHDHDKRSAKRVLRRLVQEDPDRETACWKQTPLQLLRDRSGQTGLRQFLEEVEGRLVPLLDPSCRL